MNVGVLKNIIKDLPDSMVVVVEDFGRGVNAPIDEIEIKETYSDKKIEDKLVITCEYWR